MEATALRRIPLRRREERPEAQLQDLRPLGEAYLLRRFGGSLGRADAEDAVSEVVIRLHRRIEAGKAPKNLRAAFFTSVRNAAIDQLRARAARPTVALEAAADTPASQASPDERAESHEDAARLQEALARMRGNYRVAIVLRFGVGLTVPEIAERLQISLPAAKKLVLRATEQARKRLAAIEGEDFCPEMQELARRSLFDKEAAGLASASERRVLQAHFEHCGACKTFLASLQHSLHEFGSAALLLGFGGERFGALDHLAAVPDQLSQSLSGGVEKARLAAFKASGPLQPADAASAGALGSTVQKVAAVCAAGAATTATCLATGIVGPGLGTATTSHQPDAHQRPAPKERTISEVPPPSEPPPEATAAPQASEPASQPSAEAEPPPPESEPAPEVAQTSAQQGAEEFGVESSPEPEAAPAPEPAPPPPPPPSSSSAGGGGGESFGFGG
jgi:RNA polymerase sigma factor (sigma-70 family)